MLTTNELERLMSGLESDRVECTVSTDNTDKFSQAVCAFANDLPNHRLPGYLLVGVSDNGQVAGIEVSDRLLQSLAGLRSNGNILPLPTIAVAKLSLPSGDVAVVEVLPSDLPPVRYKGQVWIRVGPRKATASEQEERILSERRTARVLTADATPLQEAKLSDLSLALFAAYRQSAIDPEVIEGNHRSIEEQLASLRFFDLDRNCPTVAGVLMFGTNSRYFLPGSYVQYLRLPGTSLTDAPADEAEISGDMLSVLRELDTRTKVNIHTTIERVSVLREKIVSNYPEDAVRELTLNAILHRDYLSNTPVRFYWFSDRIEIHNPGGLFGEVTIEQIAKRTSYRNPVIAEVLKTMGYVNRYGRGIQRAQDALAANGNPRAEFEADQRAFLAVIRGEASMKIIAFFNNKGGVGKTSLVYHLAWMFADRGKKVLAVDLDPQANLTSMFLKEDRLVELWESNTTNSVYESVLPLIERQGDILPCSVEMIEKIALLPGKLALSRFEDQLSENWPKCLAEDIGAFRVITAFYRIILHAVEKISADLVLMDVGPNLGAINRSALIAADQVILPLAPDLFSLQGMKNLGPTLREWRRGWKKRLEERPQGMTFPLPEGEMRPSGYVIMQHSVREDRPVKAYQAWADRIPTYYCNAVLDQTPVEGETIETDPHKLALLKHYRSLMPMAQDAHKPIFHLTAADGAIGAHTYAVRDCYADFLKLAKLIGANANLEMN